MLRNIFILAFTAMTFMVQGQGLGLHFMDDVWQQNYTNPALVPQQKFFLSFPSFYAGMSTNISSTESLFKLNGNTLTSNFSNYVESIDKDLFIRLDVGSEPFAIGFKTKTIHWTLSTAFKSYTHVNTSSTKDFFNLIINGNEAFIGETVSINPAFKMGLYQEYGLGASFKFRELVSIGLRAKYLVGLTTIETTTSNLSLTTSDEFYQLNFNTDIGVNLGGFPEIIDIDSTSGDFNINAFPNNRGFAIDLGGSFFIGDRVKVTASVLDLGGINWKENAQNVRLQGDFDFDGIDIAGYLLGTDPEVGNPLDSLKDSYTFASNQGGFSTSLSTKVYLSGTYFIKQDLKAGVVLRSEFTGLGTLTSFGINIQKNFGKILNVGLMYSIQNGTYANLGANLGLKLGPIQFFAVSDNLLVALNPLAGSNANMRFGINIAINDKEKFRDDK